MELTRSILGLLAVFALLSVVLRALKHKTAARGSFPRRSRLAAVWPPRFPFGFGIGAVAAPPKMQRLARMPLTPQHMLHLVQLDGKDLLIATHPGGLSVIAGLAQSGQAVERQGNSAA